MKNKSFLCLVIILFSTNMLADHNDTCAKVVFYSSKETLRRIIQTIFQRKKGIYLRFGQKDIEIATNLVNSLPDDTRGLQGEMRETFCIAGPTSFRSLPYPCKGLNAETIPIEQMPSRCKEMVQDVEPYWGGPIANLYDRDALPLLSRSTHDVHYALRCTKLLKGTPSLIFIGSETISPQIRTALFGTSCKFISVSETNAHQELDRIERECMQYAQGKPYTIIAFSAGFAGRIVAKRLWHKLNNIFLFDFGPLPTYLTTQAGPYSINYDHMIAMLSRDTKILYTAAIIPYQFEFRKNEYLRTLNILKEYWHEPYIVDACTSTPTFLEQNCTKVYHSQVNNAALKNKGVNEVRSMIQAVSHYNFDDNDLIIKLTGRYHFKSDSFLRLVESTPEIDGYVTLDPRTFFSFTGCFGLRGKYFKEMLSSIDLNHMERAMIDEEKIVLDYMRKIEKEHGAKIMYLDEVDIKSFVAHCWDFDW